MAKSILGVDIGYDSVKLALVKGTEVRKTAVAPMPVNLMKEGRFTSVETMGELLRTAMKENGIRASRAAVVLPGEVSYIRSVVMPRMTAKQLTINLPYEFNDYITDELRNYAFDYAMTEDPNETEGDTMELMAAAAPLAVLDELRDILRKAGLKLVKAAPTVCSYIPLIRGMQERGTAPAEFCIIDLGCRAIRMHMFQGHKHNVTRALDIGLSSLDDVIANEFNVDVHLAHTYFINDYDNCRDRDYCISAYNNIAVELMRALNFYRFSNPDSQLGDVWLCGGGAIIPPLEKAIADALDMRVHHASELVEGGDGIEDCFAFIQAIGSTMDEGGR